MNPTMELYLAELKASHSPVTIARHREHLAHFDRWLNGRPFDRATLVNFIAECQFSRSYLASIERTVRAFYKWGFETGDIPEFVLGRPKVHYESQFRPEECVFSPEEYEKIKKAALKWRGHEWWTGAVIVAWNTGLRIGDIANLRWTEIDLHKRVITVQPRKTASRSKIVQNPISPELAAYLKQNPISPEMAAYQQADLVFPQMHRLYGDGVKSSLSGEFRKLCRKAGVRGKTFHGLRHTFTTTLLNANVPIGTVSEMTGQSLAAMNRYLHVTFQQKQAAFRLAFKR